MEDSTLKYRVNVYPSTIAGKPVYKYTVDCAITGREIASGCGDSVEQAQMMVMRITSPEGSV